MLRTDRQALYKYSLSYDEYELFIKNECKKPINADRTEMEVIEENPLMDKE